MKKHSLMVLFFVMVPSFMFAQFSVGVKASPMFIGGYTYINGDIENDLNISGGLVPFNLGVFGNYTFKEKFGIQLEMNTIVESFSTDNEDNGWIEFTYIDVPILFQYRSNNRRC